MKRVGLVVLLLMLVVMVPSAAAHTGLFAASPAPGSTVGGAFSTYQLVFNEEVSEVVAWLEDPQGNEFGESVLANNSGSVIEFTADQLTEDGRYIVRYTLISADGDFIESGYNFTYEASAPAPLPASVPIGSGGRSWQFNAAIAGAMTSVAALAVLLLWRVRQVQALSDAAESATPNADPNS